MKKTLVKIGGVLIITALMSAVTLAADKPAVDKPAAANDSGAKIKQLEAMGAARARLQQAVQGVLDLTDAGVSGYNVKTVEIQRNYDKTCQLLDKAIQKEQAKPAAEQNAENLKAMNYERASVTAFWSKYTSVDKAAIDARLTVVSQLLQTGLNPVCASLSAMDSSCTKLNLDMDALKSMYESVEKRAKEMKAEQKAALADLDNQGKAWRDILINATSRYNAWTGESEKADK